MTYERDFVEFVPLCPDIMRQLFVLADKTSVTFKEMHNERSYSTCLELIVNIGNMQYTHTLHFYH